RNAQGVVLTCINTVEQGMSPAAIPAGPRSLSIELKKVPYLPGTFFASIWVMNPNGHIYAQADDAIRFEIGQGDLYGTREIDHRWGCVYTNIDFASGEGPILR